MLALQAHVLEVLTELPLELVRCVLVHVVRVPLRVDVAVGRGQRDDPVLADQARELLDRPPGAIEVLDHLEAHDQSEAAVRMIEALNVPLLERHPRRDPHARLLERHG